MMKRNEKTEGVSSEPETPPDQYLTTRAGQRLSLGETIQEQQLCRHEFLASFFERL